jgi:hypothetical protein
MRTLLVAMLAVGVCVPAAFARKWTDSTEKRTVEAEFADFKDGKVQLKRQDGTILSLPLEKLSQTDQDFVRKAAGLPEGNRPDASSAKPRRPTSKAASKASAKRGAKAPADGLGEEAAALIGREKGASGPLGLGPLRLGMTYPQVWATFPIVVQQQSPRDGHTEYVRPPPRVFYAGPGGGIQTYKLRLPNGFSLQLIFSPPDPGVLTHITTEFYFMPSGRAGPVAAEFVVMQYAKIFGEPKRSENIEGSTGFIWLFKDQGMPRALIVSIRHRDSFHTITLHRTPRVDAKPKPKEQVPRRRAEKPGN